MEANRNPRFFAMEILMRSIGFPCRSSRTLAFVSGLLLAAIFLRAQTQKPPAGQNPPQAGTIRVNVGLVQTDVMVFDKQGHFVPDLKMNEFELRVDGKVQPIEFLEMVSAGSDHDREIWAKVPGQPVAEPLQQPAADVSNPGRTLLIFLDDWHMAADNTVRSRDAVISLLNTSMGPDDRVGIFSSSGQLAAMQVLTNDKAALLGLLEKYNFKNPGVQDMGSPPMTEAQALLIEQKDEGALSYFIGAILRTPVEYSMGQCKQLGGGMGADFDGNCRRAADETRRRATALAETSAGIAARTLSALRNLLRAAEGLPGRKLVFFLSDGFVLQYTRSDIVARLMDLTTAAARAGILVYTLDSRGLVTGTPDAKTGGAPDQRGHRMSMAANEVSAPWDVLNALAADTGGRFLKNTNALDTALITTLTEISRYYLLGWHIDPEKLKPGQHSTIKASIKGRSDLSVRVRQGSLDLSRLISDHNNAVVSPVSAQPAPPTEMEIYRRARTVIDLTSEELAQAYPDEIRGLEFAGSQQELSPLLQKVGENVEKFFRDIPNTISKEQVRRERLRVDGIVEESVTQDYNYTACLSSLSGWEEGRTDSKGREIPPEGMSRLSFLTTGLASASFYFHPKHQFGIRYRYLGRQSDEPYNHVIAFAQRPGVTDIVGSFTSYLRPAPAVLLYQGFVWIDPRTFQIVRLQQRLLTPRIDAYLETATSDIAYGEVRFESSPASFWLPREVIVNLRFAGQKYRNRHRYSDYQLFSVALEQKITPPAVKK